MHVLKYWLLVFSFSFFLSFSTPASVVTFFFSIVLFRSSQCPPLSCERNPPVLFQRPTLQPVLQRDTGIACQPCRDALGKWPGVGRVNVALGAGGQCDAPRATIVEKRGTAPSTHSEVNYKKKRERMTLFKAA